MFIVSSMKKQLFFDRKKYFKKLGIICFEKKKKKIGNSIKKSQMSFPILKMLINVASILVLNQAEASVTFYSLNLSQINSNVQTTQAQANTG